MKTVSVTIRVPVATLDRIDRFRERWMKAHPGIPMTRTSAMCHLVTSAIDAGGSGDARS